uniref:Uncharacterized protein n=1 Tax=Candidatus Kentrum sp. DK TaxID=2126562 RepID=A0A450S7F7_9GAMM|nr:MAG: hypothetical protein BECKDK2373B_GA0170837_101841 [Candidatus Kentron sp. DK]
MGGRGSRRALFCRYFRLGGSLALPVKLLRCPIADLNLGIVGNHYWPINGLLFGFLVAPPNRVENFLEMLIYSL